MLNLIGKKINKHNQKFQTIEAMKEIASWDLEPSQHMIISGVELDLRKQKDKILARKLLGWNTNEN